MLRVVKGAPDAEELAALTVVVAALSQQRRPRRRPVAVGGWGERSALFRTLPRTGPGAWAASGRTA
jgi:Acyl-CoA carboxylase epsilon subunit